MTKTTVGEFVLLVASLDDARGSANSNRMLAGLPDEARDYPLEDLPPELSFMLFQGAALSMLATFRMPPLVATALLLDLMRELLTVARGTTEPVPEWDALADFVATATANQVMDELRKEATTKQSD